MRSGAWERSAEAARPRLYYPLASLTLLRGTPLHWRLTFCPLASSITQTSLQVCVWCSREVCAVLGCARGCDGQSSCNTGHVSGVVAAHVTCT